jgi:RNase P subunit RPR2
MEDADAEKEMEAYNERRKEALEVQARALEKQRIEIEREKAAFAKKEKEMADRFSNQSERTQSDYVECTCPNCGEDFMLDKREVAR